MELEDFRSINRTDTPAKCVCGRLLDYKSNLAEVVNTARPLWKHRKTLPFEYMASHPWANQDQFFTKLEAYRIQQPCRLF